MNVIDYSKRHACSVSAFLLLVGQATFLNAQQKVLIDFGSDASYRGISVPNPDPMGHYWNSNNPGNLMPLVDVTNTPVMNAGLPMQVGWVSGVGTDSYNGAYGAGTDAGAPADYIAVWHPDLSQLGDLGVKEAAFDYATGPNPPEGLGDGPDNNNFSNFHQNGFQGSQNATKFDLIGLDPAKKYTLIFYGSHAYNNDATTTYSVYSDSGYASQIGTANLDVHDKIPSDADAATGESASDPNWRDNVNLNTVATISNLSPGADTNLYIKFIGSTGYYGYLNSMEVIASTPAGITGDYNNDGKVNAADYAIWRSHLNQAFALPNRDPANTGNVSAADFTSWKAHFGMGGPGSGAGASGAVPEPSTLCLMFLAMIGLVAISKGR